MQVSQVLDMMQALFEAAEHPDVTAVERYGQDTQPGGQSPAGIKISHRSGSSAMLWVAVPPRDARAVPLPDEMPPPRLRAARALVFAHRLLDATRPEQLTAWELCGQPGVEVPVAAAIRITAGNGSVTYLRGTSAGGSGAEPEVDKHPDYQFPEGVQSWHLRVPAPSAGRTSA
ncbi:hypothetical protein ABT336_00085 [Micromonospora sp. NPDC000207]|uniref:hypothetical protein n=1 Tax=Micromonospora sp. NPDC000207 TaxID=3154246 RepID=UPI00332C1222